MTLSPKALELMEMLPPYYAGSNITQAVQGALGLEIERFDAMLGDLVNGIYPDTADDEWGMLSLWEAQIGVPVNDPGLSLAQRRERIVGRLRARRMKSGADWEAAAEQVIGAAFTYSENQPNPYELTVLAPYPPGSALFTAVETLIRPFTPAHINIIVVSTGGFIVDVSLVDQEVI